MMNPILLGACGLILIALGFYVYHAGEKRKENAAIRNWIAIFFLLFVLLALYFFSGNLILLFQ